MARRLAFGDDTMRDPMKQVVNRLYTFHLLADDPRIQRCDRSMGGGRPEMG